MTTVKSRNSDRKYEVKIVRYGTRSTEYQLYYGGIFLTSTEFRGPNGESSSTLEVAIDRADEQLSKLGIEISE